MIRRVLETLAGIGVLAVIVAAFGGVLYLTTNPYSPLVTADWEVRAASMGVDVIVTDDRRNCGAQEHGEGGCFDERHPDRIYLSPFLPADELEYVALHELGHVYQFRHGLPLDECEADHLAQEWGAEAVGFYCPAS